MVYMLSNPTQNYTFEANDFETAALTVLSISPEYGASSADGSDDIPVFFFGGFEEWFEGLFGHTVANGLAAKKTQVLKAVRSLVLSDKADVNDDDFSDLILNKAREAIDRTNADVFGD